MSNWNEEAPVNQGFRWPQEAQWAFETCDYQRKPGAQVDQKWPDATMMQQALSFENPAYGLLGPLSRDFSMSAA
jgi:hypothetical protein